MDLRLAGKNAVVTGASKGVGLAIVAALRAEGMRVVTGSRTVTPELKETGAITCSVDLSGPDGPAELIGHALDELGEIDVLVNNVGGGDTGEGQTGGFLGFSEEHWRVTHELNFFSAVRATRAAMPALLRRRGAVVNISSIGGRMPHSGPVPYNTAKAALTAFGKALAEEFGPHGVRVNTVSPGPVATPLWLSSTGYGAALAASYGMEHQALLEALPGSMGMITGRLIEPEEVAALVAYLASPRAASVIGAEYVIDGGASKAL